MATVLETLTKGTVISQWSKWRFNGSSCCHRSPDPSTKSKCCSSKSVSPSQPGSDVLPLSKVLCNLKEAASFDRKCQGMISDLMAAQKQLQDQIQHLEHREKEGVQLLKQADCMWSCMEDAYKKKILESQERQQELIKQLKEADANTNKWRKNKKDLEFQLENINKCHQEIFEKLHQKQNDLKSMNMDIASYKKRIENNKKEIEAAKKSLTTKKQASDDKVRKISGDISRKDAMIKDEKSRKQDKENEGNQYIREARADLLNLSRILLQKRIENEDMKTEKETLIDELELLSQTYDQCKDRCQSKKKSIENEIKIIDKEIANYKAKCARCHQCTDTIDIRKFCTDCPRCLEERDCLLEGDHCSPDHTMDCVCMSVKHKFLDNVFENMYTVLERQTKTGPGKAVAEAVLNCLKRSRNGKLDQETRQILQDFILTTVKKNLNLTIVGGAVKTRCELDPDTYKQLMLCLKQVKAVRPPKADKETAAKKDPCRRWGGTSECNCPKGPKSCICTKKAPPPPEEPGPCPPPEKEDMEEVKTCPYKESAACGPDCAMHAVPSAVGTDVKAWRPDPCQGPTCTFKNMRAAQCFLGPEALNAVSSSKSYVTAVPYVPNITTMADDQASCDCGSTPTKSCSCKNDVRSHPREKIIEEVMGEYFEVTPIEKVFATKGNKTNNETGGRNNEVFVCVDTPLKSIYGSAISTCSRDTLGPYLCDIFLTQRDNVIMDIENASKTYYEYVVEKDIGHSLKSYEKDPYTKADLKQLKSYPESSEDACGSHLNENVVGDSIETTYREKNNVQLSELSEISLVRFARPLFQRKVCSVAQELIKNVIVFDDKSLHDKSTEWVTVDSLLNDILKKSQGRIADEKDAVKNELEIQTISFENSNSLNGEESNAADKKQKVVNTTNNCDKKTCGILHNTLNEDDIFIIDAEKVVGHDYSHINNNYTPNLSGLKENTINSNIKDDLIKYQYKPLLLTDSSLNIKKTLVKGTDPIKTHETKSSKVSRVDIDEKVIDFIENITKEHPDQFVSLGRTKSGNLSLGLNSVNDNNDDNIILKRSPSGNMVIEVDHNIIQTFESAQKLNNNLKSKEDKIRSSFTSRGSDPLDLKRSKNKDLTENKVEKVLLHDLKDNSKAYTAQKIITFDLLQEWYEKGVKDIDIRIKYHDKLTVPKKASLTQLSSETLAVHIKNPGINNNRLEFPVILYKTSSDIVSICLYDDETSSDIVATRTVSDGILVHKKYPINHEPRINSLVSNPNITKPNEVFKVKLKGLDNVITEPPAVIKVTASGNYDIIVEKEFEKSYAQAIKLQKEDETGSYFEIINTPSGIVLDFEKHDRVRSESKRALLIKSHSGLLKIVVSDSTVNIAEKNKAFTSGSVISAKTLGELLKKLPCSSKKSYYLRSSTTKRTKSSSDSGLYNTSKSKLRTHPNILDESSATLKKTKSGQYAVVLDKESKKSFINNLVSYIDTSMKSAIPIKRTDSGEITILLNKDLKNIGRCESLKISNSGNIYVILDEKTMKQMSNDVAVNTRKNMKDGEFSPYISKTEWPINKAIATNCNADPDDTLCDVSKCACEEWNLNEDKIKNVYENSSTDFCGKKTCSRMCVKQNIKSKMSPHIVIKPCEPRITSDNANKFHTSYYCEVQAICPYHKDRYDAVSNELLEISGLCNKAPEKMSASKYLKIISSKPKNTINPFPDSLDYLPPQLPPFLRNFTYK